MITIQLPDEIYRQSPEEFVKELRLRAAARLFEEGAVSSGKAAELAGVPRVEFLYSLQRLGVSVLNWTAEELEAELDSVEDLLQHLPPGLPPSTGPA